MRALILLIAVVLLVASCATRAKFAKNVQRYVGASEAQLIAREGTPHGVYDSGSSRFLNYKKSWSGTTEGTAPSYYTTYDFMGNATTTSSGGEAPQSWTRTCAVTFEVVAGRIVNVTFRGNGCVR